MTKLHFIALSFAAGFLVAGNLVRADEAAGSGQKIHFVGRWDLRTPNKALAVNTGSYLQAQFSGTSVNALFDLTLNQPPLPTIAWRIDNGDWQEAEVTAKVPLAQNLAAGAHTLMLMVRGILQTQSRWNSPLTGSLTFSGLDLPDGGQLLPPLADWLHPGLKIEFLGDSITEGVGVQGNQPGRATPAWQTDALHSWACETALLLHADWRQVGFGSQGLLKGGSGGVPGALMSFNFFHDHCPRDNWQPDLVVVNQGTNERSMLAAVYAPLYQAYLAMIRAAYPNAKIAALRPFVGAQAASIEQAVNATRAAGDTRVYYIDTTGWYRSVPLHPTAQTNPGIAAKLVAALKAQVLAN